MLALLAVAGGIGAALRFFVDGIVARHNPFRIPLGTLFINVTGSLLLGLLTGWVAYRSGGPVAVNAKAVVGTGLCGGYTTFSTASVEVLRLCVAGAPIRGVGYAAITLFGSVAAAAVGLWAGYIAG